MYSSLLYQKYVGIRWSYQKEKTRLVNPFIQADEDRFERRRYDRYNPTYPPNHKGRTVANIYHKVEAISKPKYVI